SSSASTRSAGLTGLRQGRRPARRMSHPVAESEKSRMRASLRAGEKNKESLRDLSPARTPDATPPVKRGQKPSQIIRRKWGRWAAHFEEGRLVSDCEGGARRSVKLLCLAWPSCHRRGDATAGESPRLRVVLLPSPPLRGRGEKEGHNHG